MSPDEQRIAIAQACGWKIENSSDWKQRLVIRPDGSAWRPSDPRVPVESLVPDYLGDLNAMREAKGILSPDQRLDYINELCLIVRHQEDGPYSSATKAYFADAGQEAEAFLKTLGLWKEAANA